jgi:hypothetical protein
MVSSRATGRREARGLDPGTCDDDCCVHSNLDATSVRSSEVCVCVCVCVCKMKYRARVYQRNTAQHPPPPPSFTHVHFNTNTRTIFKHAGPNTQAQTRAHTKGGGMCAAPEADSITNEPPPPSPPPDSDPATCWTSATHRECTFTDSTGSRALPAALVAS